MMKVIIADDEPKVALLIKSLIDWYGLEMELSGIAKNGIEALDLVRLHDPDIVITDIRMPVTGGLELISEAKEIKPELEFIIISGYKHFDYAHSAIKFGVSDYLLKPINQDELGSTLQKVKHRIISRASSMYEHERVRQIESDKERSKRLELFGLLSDPDTDDLLNADYLNNELGYSFTESDCYRYVTLKVDGEYSEIYSDALSVFNEKNHEMMTKTLSSLCDDIEVEFINSKTNIVLGFPPENRQQLRDALKNVFYDIRVQNNIIPSAVFTLICGSIAETPAGLRESWKEVEWALQERLLIGTGSFYENLHIKEGAVGAASLAARTAEKLEQALDVMDFQVASIELKEACESMLKLNGLTGKDVSQFVKHIHDEWLILRGRYDTSFADAERPRSEFSKKYELLSSAADVFAFLQNTILDSFEGILANLDRMSGRPVSSAKQYIREHFGENISISDIAEQEGFNVSYFSTLFKKETGQTFSEYLTKVRMDEAKRLLKETNLSVALICEAVGHSDVRHFTATFKKTAGIKPSEYRKLYSWGR